MKHKLIHKMLAAVCSFALLLTLAPTAYAASENAGNPFTDIAPGAYYTDAVLWAYETGVAAGTTDTTFSPDSACTRGQVMAFLWRAMGRPEPIMQDNPFEDVKSSDYYYKPILWAYENGIAVGITDTTFGPNDTCTNGHVVTFLWRANGQPNASGTSTLADSFPTDYYTNAVAWADSSGLLADTDTAFSPSAQSPRANIVTYLYRNQAVETTQPSQPEEPSQTQRPAQPEPPEEPSQSQQPPQSEPPEEPSQAQQPSQSEPPEEPSQTQQPPQSGPPEEPSQSQQPPQPEPPEEPEESSPAKLANGTEITDDNIRAIIYGLQSEYPEGRKWTNDDSYVSHATRTIGYGCAAFGLICSDAVFGDFPVSNTHSDFDCIRVGDLLRVANNTHTVVVLEKKENSVIVAEGNYNSSIHWGREISRRELEQENFYAECRYPA